MIKSYKNLLETKALNNCYEAMILVGFLHADEIAKVLLLNVLMLEFSASLLYKVVLQICHRIYKQTQAKPGAALQTPLTLIYSLLQSSFVKYLYCAATLQWLEIVLSVLK